MKELQEIVLLSYALFGFLKLRNIIFANRETENKRDKEKEQEGNREEKGYGPRPRPPVLGVCVKGWTWVRPWPGLSASLPPVSLPPLRGGEGSSCSGSCRWKRQGRHPSLPPIQCSAFFFFFRGKMAAPTSHQHHG